MARRRGLKALNITAPGQLGSDLYVVSFTPCAPHSEFSRLRVRYRCFSAVTLLNMPSRGVKGEVVGKERPRGHL